MKILIVFYSTYGHVYKMAEAVAEGAKAVKGAEAEIRRVPETLPQEVLEKMGAVDAQKAISQIPECTVDDLAEADAVIFGGYHPEASKLVGQMKRKRVEVPFIGPDGVKGDGFLEIAGKDAEGVYATGPMDVSAYAANKQAKDAYVAKYGKEPGTFFDQGYAAMQAILNAIEESGGTEYAGLEKALRGSYVDTAVGKIKFDAKGDAEGVGFSVFQVQDGKFVELK